MATLGFLLFFFLNMKRLRIFLNEAENSGEGIRSFTSPNYAPIGPVANLKQETIDRIIA